MEPMNDEVVEIDVKELFYIILRRFWIILIAGLLGTGIAFAYSYYLVTPIYTSTAKVYVINRQNENGTTWSDIQSGTYLAKDYMILVKSRPVTEEVINRLEIDLTDKELSKMISVSAPADTRILEISIDHEDAVIAKQLADAIAEVSSERMVSVMEMQKVNIVESGDVAEEPSSPSVRRNTILGGLIGGALATFIIILMYIMNDTIKTSDDIEKHLGITVLGAIPIDQSNKRKKNKRSKKKKRLKETDTALAS